MGPAVLQLLLMAAKGFSAAKSEDKELEREQAEKRKEREEKNALPPQERVLLRQYFAENPNAEKLIRGIPEYEKEYKTWTQSLLETGGKEYKTKPDEAGVYSGGTRAASPRVNPQAKGREPIAPVPPGQQMQFGAKGLQPVKTQQFTKQTLIGRIVQKAMTEGLDSLATNEKQILGIKESVKSAKDLKPIDRLRIRRVAADMAKANNSTTEIMIPEATKFLFPNLESEITPEDAIAELKRRGIEVE